METAHAENHARTTAGAGEQLHRLQRAPSDVASEWRSKLGDDELATIERVSDTTYARLLSARLPLSC